MAGKNHTDSYPINTQKGLETFGGDEDLFKTMIESFEKMTFDNCCERVYKGMKAKNWKDVESGAHQLKGASGYIGAVKFSEVCENLQHAAKKPDINEDEVLGIYLEMMAEGKELKIALAKRNGLPKADLTELDKYYSEFVKQPKEAVSQPSLRNNPPINTALEGARSEPCCSCTIF